MSVRETGNSTTFQETSPHNRDETLTLRPTRSSEAQMPDSRNRYSRKRGPGAIPGPQFAFKNSMIH
jgi:hypothetical protein